MEQDKIEQNSNFEIENTETENTKSEMAQIEVIEPQKESKKGKNKKEKKEKEKKEKEPRTKWKDLPTEVRKKKRKKYILIGVGVIILFFFIVSKISAANAKMPVTTVAATVGDVEATITTSGKVESDVTKTYYSQISGNIGSIPVKEGQAVKAGDVLLYFDEQSLEIASKDAQAAALTSEGNYNDTMNQNTKTQARLTEANVNLEVLEQQITDYKAFIKQQEEKYEDTRNARKASLSAWGMELAKEQAEGEDVAEEMAEYQYCLETLDISKDLVDIQRTINEAKETLSNLEEYKAEMKSQKSATQDNVMSETAKEAQKTTNEATQLKNAQMVDYAASVEQGLKADFDGVITQMQIAEGSPVNSGSALVTIASNSRVHVTINLSKSDLAKVEEGQKADVTIAGKKYEGEVSFINHVATTNANNMPVVEAQIAITNADEEIYLGVEAKVVVYAQKAENVLVVPVEAVNSDKDGDFVYVVENNIVTRKDVVTGVSSDTYIEVVDGLTENDQVMTEISLTITEGMEVMAVPAEGTSYGNETEIATEASVEIDVNVESE